MSTHFTHISPTMLRKSGAIHVACVLGTEYLHIIVPYLSTLEMIRDLSLGKAKISQFKCPIFS